MQVLSKTMDSTTLSSEKVELATITRKDEEDLVSCLSGLATGWL